MAECCRCGRRKNNAGSWPDGYVCRTCSDRAVRTRGPVPAAARGAGNNQAVSTAAASSFLNTAGTMDG